MPRLWNDTIEAHRRDVREAILDATAALVTTAGPRSVTMSRIAQDTGIGRATLYKYFPDLYAVLDAWHQRQISVHLAELAELADGPGDPLERLQTVLRRYGYIIQERLAHERPQAELSAALHRGLPATVAQQQVHEIIQRLITHAAGSGVVRSDAPPGLLAGYCLNALSAPADHTSPAEMDVLVTVTLDGMKAQS